MLLRISLVTFALLVVGCGDSSVVGDGSPPALDGAAEASPPDMSRADATPDSGPSKATVTLSYTGCSASFAGSNRVMIEGQKMTISSGASAASLQIVFKQTLGTVVLSSMHRQQTGFVVELVAGGTTYTNTTFDPDVISGQKPDPIKGSIVIDLNNLSNGVSKFSLVGVTLESNMPPHGHCTVDGRVETKGKSP